jgi:hypothetical protein
MVATESRKTFVYGCFRKATSSVARALGRQPPVKAPRKRACVFSASIVESRSRRRQDWVGPPALPPSLPPSVSETLAYQTPRCLKTHIHLYQSALPLNSSATTLKQQEKVTASLQGFVFPISTSLNCPSLCQSPAEGTHPLSGLDNPILHINTSTHYPSLHTYRHGSGRDQSIVVTCCPRPRLISLSHITTRLPIYPTR